MQADVFIRFVQWQRYREIAVHLGCRSLNLFGIGRVRVSQLAGHLREMPDAHVASQKRVLNGFFARSRSNGFDLSKH
jgi:hypothetical protein